MPTSPSLRKPPWIEIVRRYQQPDVRAAARQLLDTFPLCLACFAAAWWMLRYHWLLSLPCSLLAGAMVIRVFIIQHDCGHGSFLPRKLWNDLIGMGCSLLTLTPYLAWRHDHAVHHATAGNLEHRGTGDIKTLTVAEFRSANRWRQLVYRLYRHPVVLFGIGPVVHFALLQRFTTKLPPAARRERRSVHFTNLALLAVYGGLGALIGYGNVLLVLVPAMVVAASAGVFLFYVQHQFDEAYWAHEDDWDYEKVALKGSSYYRLPRLLQWLTGNIGFHHVHHLSPRIPNYRLEACHRENPLFHQARVIDLRESLRTIPLTLWDEQRQRLISFAEHQRQIRQLDRAA